MQKTVRSGGEPLSCVAAVNVTNLIQWAGVGDGVIKSTQVTNKGESNYFTKKNRVRGDILPFIPASTLHPPPRLEKTADMLSLLHSFLFLFFLFFFSFNSCK